MSITFQPEAFAASIAGVSVSLEPESLPVESHVFIYAYGLRQYIQDGAAVSKLVKDGEVTREKTADEIATEKAEGVAERIENLKSGEFTRRTSAPKLSPEEKERQSVIMAGLKAFASSRKQTLPAATGKNAKPEQLAKLVAAWYAKYKDDVDKEVARRMKLTTKHLGDVTDLDALLEMAEVAAL